MLNRDLISTLTLTINAPVAKVWDGLTNPAMIKQWLFGTDTKTTWEPGSDLIFSGEWSGQAYEDKGKVVVFEPEKVLEYTYWSAFSKLPDAPENYSRVRFVLSDKGDITEMVVTQTGFTGEEAKQHSMDNWRSTLGKMKELVEENN